MNNDPFVQDETIRRRRALLDTLLAQSQQSQITGPAKFAIPTALAKVATAFLAGKGMDTLDTEDIANRELRSQQLRGEAEGLLNQIQGAPGVEGTVGDFEGLGGSMTPPTPPDRRAAVLSALTSRFPELQAFGRADLVNLGKQEAETFGQPVTLRGPDGKLVAPRFGNRGSTLLMQGLTPFERPLVVADRVVDPTQPSAVQADFSKKFEPSFIRPGSQDRVQIESTSGKETTVDNAPRVSVNNQTNIAGQGQKAGFEAFAKLAATTVGELATTARQSTRLLTQLDRMESLTKAGTQAGPFAGGAVFLQGLVKQAGGSVDVAQLANSETFTSVATQAWAALIQQNGGARGLVKEESDRLAQALPSLLQSPEGRAEITTFLRGIANQNISDARQAAKEFSTAINTQDPEKFTFGLSNTILPQSPSPGTAPIGPGASAAPIPLEEFLRQQRARKGR